MGSYPFAYKIEIDEERLPDGKICINYTLICNGFKTYHPVSIDADIFLPSIFMAMMEYSGMEFRGILTDYIRTERKLTEYEISSLEDMVSRNFHIPIKLSKN